MGKAARERTKRTTTVSEDPTMEYLAAFEAKQKFLGTVLNMGWRLAITFVIPVIIGAWLDRRYDASPSYTLTGIFVAVFGAVYVIRDTVKDVNEEMAAEEKLATKAKNKRKKNV